MDKQTKVHLLIVGIVVVGMIVTWFITKDLEDVKIVFGIGIFPMLIGPVFAGGESRVHDFKKQKGDIEQQKIRKKRPLPIYRRFELLCAITLEIFLLFSGFNIYIFLFLLIFFIIVFWPSKALYLCKSNENVIEYSNNIENFRQINELHNYLSNDRYINNGNGHNSYRWRESFIKTKCEKIKLDNSIEFWGCLIDEISAYFDDPIKKSYNLRKYIFAFGYYDIDYKVNILLTNIFAVYARIIDGGMPRANPYNTYFSDYSNVPLAYICSETDKIICSKIDKICSDFFAKTRSKYVLIIENGQIGLGLKAAKFGKFNRIINKKRTKKLTEEAMQEISEFLLQIKSVIEKY